MIFSYLLNMQSHPSWVCGLKRNPHCLNIGQQQSHPSWVCGLKLLRLLQRNGRIYVTSFVGVWIETYQQQQQTHHHTVTSFVGVWIETALPIGILPNIKVTSFVGVWIET